MTLVKGNAGDKPEKKESNEQMELLLANFKSMQEELASLKAAGQPQAGVMPGGMTANQLAEVIKAVKDRPDSEKYDVRRHIDERDIDKDDYDQVGVSFCAYSTGYLIVDDVRQGQAVRTPYGKSIFFVFQGSKRFQAGKYQELSTYCEYKSHSKREQEWLRNHRYYGVMFFESAKDVLQGNAKKANRMVNFMNALNSLDQHGIIQRCKERSVPITDNLHSMRITLAYKMAEDEEANEQVAAAKRVEEQFETTIFK